MTMSKGRRAKTGAPGEWPWSSYRATAGSEPAADWLEIDALRARFGPGRTRALRRHVRFVAEGMGAPSLWQELRGQIYLGDERFVRRMQARLDAKAGEDVNVPKTQRRAPAPALASIAARHKDRNQAMLAVHGTGQYSYQQIAEHFGVRFTTVGRIVRAGRVAGGNPEDKRPG